ncbi:spermatogenesis-associated protein 45 isoform X1 [Pelodiscus sinensis]|uniref:spermatogenesis-associated protein 45 isoform X1 n=1 Tax=Pelodiscus sinensis TaxID=13735 RepID=UPI0007046A7D|nr:spermatogenesis-associated protein 45 isoform X1 [Pelodiscus sinensis]XP_025042182.1 spermatogenesis-associated protein 45 isoform X1 [Pelodiscus sinensis]|eukprot:XP_014430761.1 spermatogenesis-associated protein 45 isoform X1 [Pelodiscus sinensis]
MGESEKKRLIELNMTRDSLCMVEGKGDSTWLRPQRRHFPQSNRSSLENYREKEPEPDTGRSSWTALTPPHHKERRHFPERRFLLRCCLHLPFTKPQRLLSCMPPDC